MFDSRREGLSLQTAVCSTASSSASNSISMQSNHQMRHCTCDIFNHACAMSPWIVISVRQLDGWLALKLLRNLSGMNPFRLLCVFFYHHLESDILVFLVRVLDS